MMVLPAILAVAIVASEVSTVYGEVPPDTVEVCAGDPAFANANSAGVNDSPVTSIVTVFKVLPSASVMIAVVVPGPTPVMVIIPPAIVAVAIAPDRVVAVYGVVPPVTYTLVVLPVATDTSASMTLNAC